MATFKDVERLIAGLPEVTIGEKWGRRTWMIGGKGFAWERPFSKADVKRFGEQTPPDGPILAIRTADMAEKEAILATASSAFFNIAHFQGYPGLLIQLSHVDEDELREALVDAWLACAPPKLADSYLAEHKPT